jgi:hypothetical protein
MIEGTSDVAFAVAGGGTAFIYLQSAGVVVFIY